MNAGNDFEFVDTNILVYAFDIMAGSKHERARNLLANLWLTGHGCISLQILQEFYVTMTQKVAKPLRADVARQIIGDLMQWRIHVPAPPDILEAIDIQQRNRLSFWDAMVLRSAGKLGCRVLWTEDLNARQNYEGVTVLNPFS